MGEFFGTDGIRGVAGQYPLDQNTIERIGYSLANNLSTLEKRDPLIVIGRDTRESGEWIERAIARGIHAARGTIRSAGVITTPGVAYLTSKLSANAGVVISASHNPYEDNGIKIFSSSGRKLDDSMEAAIETDLKATPSSPPNISETKIESEHLLKEMYLRFLRDEIGSNLKFKGLKLVIDCANGASYELAPRLFNTLGAEVTLINADPNGRNINLNCGSLHPETLQRAVIENKADAGIAFDGDADRLLMVDERGELIDGDLVLFIMAEFLSARGKLSGNRVVATIMSNLGLELALKERGIELKRTSVGDKYVLEELIKGGGSIGGEQSGHIIFPEISFAGDGMLSALEVLRVVADSKKTLSGLTVGFTRYPQVMINTAVARKPPLESIPAISDAMRNIESKLAESGRLLVRYSGTENKVRVMVEGEDKNTIQKMAEELAELIGKHLSE